MLSGAVGYGAKVVRRYVEFGPTLTIQSEIENCDINVIMDRFTKNGGMVPQIMMPPLATDFNQVASFQDAMALIVKARESFESLPAAVRARFGNSPEAFLQFCDDERNIPEMLKLGIAVPKDKVRNPDDPVLVKVIADDKEKSS